MSTRLPFGISQYTTGSLSFEKDLELFREAGVEHIEICEGKVNVSDPHPQLQRVRDLGFGVSSVQPRFHSPLPNSIRAGRESTRERMQHLRATIRLCSRYFPGTTLVVNTGLAPGGDVASAFRIASREFRSAARYASAHGVRLALEPLNPVFMNTDTFICSLAHAERMMDAVDHPQFGVFLDVWHFWEEADALTRIGKLRGKIFGVHISDWRMPRRFADRLLPGSGEIPLDELLRCIRRVGYRGIYTLEIFSDPDLPDSLWGDPRRTVTRGRNAFKKIWSRLCA